MRKTALAVASVLACSQAVAADPSGQSYITPRAGVVFADGDRNVDSSAIVYGLGFGHHFSSRWATELNLLTSEPLDLDSGRGNLKLRAVSLDFVRHFNVDGRVSPYLTFGAGVLNDRYTQLDSSKNAMAQVGAGLLWTLRESGTGSLSLRPEVKARLDETGATGDMIDYLATVGLQFAFGGKPAAAPVAVAAPAPAPAPVAAPPPPPPPPAPVDADGDGVLDNRDQCLGTPAGTLVDTVGCPQRGSITLAGVNFETNSAQLTADSRPVLARVAADLKRFPRLKVEVQGHTDSQGSDQYNQGLSQRRADSVRTFLLGEGVAADQVTARGYGESQPVADNGNAEGRAQNRRVVMAVVDNPGNVDVQGSAAR